jgi:DNA-directed RNA polymerase specialized sigma24 family protein
VSYLEAQAPSQDKVLEAKQFLALFDHLSDSDQEILLLVGAEGLKYEEAADVVGIPVGTVRSRVFRARERLQAMAARMNTLGDPTVSKGGSSAIADFGSRPHYA